KIGPNADIIRLLCVQPTPLVSRDGNSRAGNPLPRTWPAMSQVATKISSSRSIRPPMTTRGKASAVSVRPGSKKNVRRRSRPWRVSTAACHRGGMMRFVRRLWRVTVLAAAALAFLLAWFLDYDGLGQVLGLGGTAGRIALAALAAAVIALVVARFTREPPAAPTPARKT